MCGIFSYIGPRNEAKKITIEGLKKLEYRGYDSWGISFKNQDNSLGMYKQVGKISDIPKDLFELKNESKIAIGHSRWATHGGVTKENSHPHYSQDKKFALVHNGIFENHEEIRNELIQKGYEFRSETDSEVAAYLIEENYKESQDIVGAIQKTTETLEGRYAILVMNEYDDSLIVARRGSPLIIGVNEFEGQKEFFVASDIPAFLQYTKQVNYLDNEQMAIIRNGEIKFVDLKTKETIQKRTIEVDIKAEEAELGEHAHYMIKEIWDQKDSIIRAINQDENQIQELAKKIQDAFGTFVVGCGGAGIVGQFAVYTFAKIAKKHINFEFGSEFDSQQYFIKPGSLVIAISQSGETADTLEALNLAKEKGATLASIVNVDSSTMARLTDFTLPINAGPEIGVASTKATTAQMAIITLLAFAVANKLEEGRQLLLSTSSRINDMLNPRYEEHIKKLAVQIKDTESMYVIGKGANYPSALECALKLQEISYIHAEGFAAGELKHGPLALISEGTPVIALAPKDESYTQVISNASEIKARGGYIIGVSPENNPIFDYWIKVPSSDLDSPILNIIPIQILSYHLGLLKNNDPDKPRNLAKSVTVK